MSPKTKTRRMQKQLQAWKSFFPAPCFRPACVLSTRLGWGRCSPAIRPPRTISFRTSMPRSLSSGADPPVSGEQLAIVESVAKLVSNLLFVLNKADRVNPGELATATAFARRVLEKRLNRPVPVIFETSATEQIENRGSGRDWKKWSRHCKSWLMAPEAIWCANRHSALWRAPRSNCFGSLPKSGKHCGARSRSRSAGSPSCVRLLRRPNDPCASLATFSQPSSTIFPTCSATVDERFWRRCNRRARQELDHAFHSLPRKKSGPVFRRQLMHAAQQIAKERLLPWLEREEHDAERAYKAVAQRFVGFANEFLNRLATTGLPELAQLPRALDPEKGFRARSEFHFNLLERIAAPASPFRLVADFALGAVAAYNSFHRDAQQFLDQLLEWNSARVRGDVDNRVLESRHWLETEIRILLREVTAVAERALAHAQKLQAEGAAAVDNALARLDALEAEIRSLATSNTTAPTL